MIWVEDPDKGQFDKAAPIGYDEAAPKGYNKPPLETFYTNT